MEAEGDSAATLVAAQTTALPTPPSEAAVGDDGLALLRPALLRLHRGPTGVLRATLEGDRARSYLQVSVYRAFPLTHASEWVVLLDAQGKEIGTLRDPAALDAESHALLEQELALRYLTPRVTEILAIHEEMAEGGGWTPAMVWEMDTDRGRVRMRLPNLADHLRGVAPGRLLISDREGRRVEIADVASLSPASRTWLGRYLTL